VFHALIWGAWSFVLGGLAPKSPPWRRDWIQRSALLCKQSKSWHDSLQSPSLHLVAVRSSLWKRSSLLFTVIQHTEPFKRCIAL